MYHHSETELLIDVYQILRLPSKKPRCFFRYFAGVKFQGVLQFWTRLRPRIEGLESNSTPSELVERGQAFVP